MKLRNKTTGEILDVKTKYLDLGLGHFLPFDSLAELSEEWEDYEEPKTFWYMTAWGEVKEYSQDQFAIKQKQAIGNYFETKEEAEKAVERLRAWKRLKDKGFRFMEGRLDNNDDFIIKAKLGHVGLIDQPDVHLLFGGEE